MCRFLPLNKVTSLLLFSGGMKTPLSSNPSDGLKILTQAVLSPHSTDRLCENMNINKPSTVLLVSMSILYVLYVCVEFFERNRVKPRFAGK